MSEEHIGYLSGLWRYPVKSMRGEAIGSATVGTTGLLGDRAFALLDEVTGKVLSAKKYGKLLELGASYANLTVSRQVPPARIHLPQGRVFATDDPEAGEALSAYLGRPVRVIAATPATSQSYDVDHTSELPGVPPEGMSFPCPPGAFHDAMHLHFITSNTIAQLERLYPTGLFDPRRLRPNFLIDTVNPEVGFLEDHWIGHALHIGDSVRVMVVAPTIRCVMTTLPQDELPKDPAILRTAAQHHQNNIGCYALVRAGGEIRLGDPVVSLGPSR